MLESTITYNGLVLNNQANRDISNPPGYWYRVFSVDGLFDQDVRSEVHDLPHRHGTATGDFYYSGKTIVITGRIYAKDLTLLRQAQRALQQAFYDLQDHQLSFTLWGESGVYITCRKNQKIDMPEVQNDGGPSFKRDFVIQLYADDPRMYSGSGAYPVWT